MQPILLIVDDDPEDFDILRDCLVQVGFQGKIMHAPSGDEALALLRATPQNLPYLIILDLVLPRANGLEVLMQMKGQFQIPVIVHTTDCSDYMIQKLRAQGALDCLKKGTTYSDNIRFAKHIVSLAEATG